MPSKFLKRLMAKSPLDMDAGLTATLSLHLQKSEHGSGKSLENLPCQRGLGLHSFYKGTDLPCSGSHPRLVLLDGMRRHH